MTKSDRLTDRKWGDDTGFVRVKGQVIAVEFQESRSVKDLWIGLPIVRVVVHGPVVWNDEGILVDGITTDRAVCGRRMGYSQDSNWAKAMDLGEEGHHPWKTRAIVVRNVGAKVLHFLANLR